MNPIEYITEPSLTFYNFEKKTIQDNIWPELLDGLWRQLDIEAYLFNNTLAETNLINLKPIFKGYQQIVPGTYWDKLRNKLDLKLYKPKFLNSVSFTKFLNICENYLDSLKFNRIGVHLSGGLDTGLIIGILKQLGIPFVPIGLKSNTFEFRTERYIQEKLLDWGEDGALIDLEEYPFYSNLTSLRKHQIPDASIKSEASSVALATTFKQKGCDLVFSGQGGDSLFVEEIKDFNKLSFNIEDEFMLIEERDRIYAPLGIKLESFFSYEPLINYVSSARLGLNSDPLKLWVRNWAKDILPKELSNYSYCADYFGLSMHGLNKARDVIKLLLEEAYDISSDAHFAKPNIKRFLNVDVFSFEHSDYLNYCGLISVACWYHSLFGNE